MSDLNSFASIQLLKNLFDQCREEDNSSDSDLDSQNDEIQRKENSVTRPQEKPLEKSENPLIKKVDVTEPSPKSIQEWEILQETDQDLLDNRKIPGYSISYKQSVKTEDIFLQMSFKTPATSSCEDMIIDINLSEETGQINDMDLKVLQDKIDLQTPIYRLILDLPHRVDPNKARAQYDPEKKVFKLTLRLNRELDFVNF